MDAKPGECRKRGFRLWRGFAPWTEGCGVQVHQSNYLLFGTRVGIIGPRPTWRLHGPTGTFDPQCCRAACAVLRVARFRNTTWIPPFIRPGLWLHPVNSPGRPMCVQVLQSTKPTAVEPQCSVVPSRQTGPVIGWVPAWHCDGLPGTATSLHPGRHTPVNNTAPAFTGAANRAMGGFRLEVWSGYMASEPPSPSGHGPLPLRVSAMFSFTNTGLVQVRIVIVLRVSS